MAMIKKVIINVEENVGKENPSNIPDCNVNGTATLENSWKVLNSITVQTNNSTSRYIHKRIKNIY